MPGDKEVRLKVVLDGADKVTNLISGAVKKGWSVFKTGSMPAVYGPQTRAASAMSKVGAAAGVAGGAMATMAAGPMAGMSAVSGPLGKIVELLSSLAPIQAILTVVGTIFKLALLPLSMILMAILMPFLMPVLQLFSKLPWATFMKVTQELSGAISATLGFILNCIIDHVAAFLVVISVVIKAVQGYIAAWGAILNNIWTGLTIEVSIVRQVLTVLGGWLGKAVGFLQKIGGILDYVWGFYAGIFGDAIGVIASAVSGAWSVLGNIWDWFDNTMGGVFQAIGTGIETVVSVLNTVANALGSVNPANWHMPSLAVGGVVQASGIAMIHAGERIVPAKAVQRGGGGDVHLHVNITGNTISKDMDLTKITNKVQRAIGDNVRRLRTY